MEIPQQPFKMKLIEEKSVKTAEKSSATKKAHQKSVDSSASQYNLTPKELKMVLDRFKSRIANLRSTCEEINSKDIWARNGLALTVEEKDFIACASWKCRSNIFVQWFLKIKIVQFDILETICRFIEKFNKRSKGKADKK